MSVFVKIGKNILWGNSVALAWLWGLGLFLAVQIAIQFGFEALVRFATIDAFGLTLFGLLNAYLSRNLSAEEYENKFFATAKNFKFALIFYQFVACALTLYATLKYVTLPLQIFSILVCVMFIGAVIFLGEEFNIQRIKYSHAVFGILIITSIFALINSPLFSTSYLTTASGVAQEGSAVTDWLQQAYSYKPLYSFKSNFVMLMFQIPFIVGFICGPWLDLQNWQRVIQIKKEKASLVASYLIAGLFFWFLILADGAIAISAYQYAQALAPKALEGISSYDIGSLFYSAKSTITHVLSSSPDLEIFLAFYVLFVGLASLTTYDSAYIAYKWYTNAILKDSKNIILSFIPAQLISSPVPMFFAIVITSTVTLHFSEFGRFVSMFDARLQRFFNFELEYYIAFFASFFVIYSIAFFRSLYQGANFSALKLFATALASIAVFGIGYFGENPLVMSLASLLPFVYVNFWNNPQPNVPIQEAEESTSSSASNVQVNFIVKEISPSNLPQGALPVALKGCYLQDSWFCHQFIPTYQDTNSVGNVYFAMYLMWVGKVRELFFTHVVPGFDPKTSSYLILTRGIEHKFVKEIREFDEVVIQIRIADYNRKFVNLEHRILDARGDIVGKGRQSLMFVDSKTYALIDLPPQIQEGFLPYVSQLIA